MLIDIISSTIRLLLSFINLFLSSWFGWLIELNSLVLSLSANLPWNLLRTF
jgi:hypothetical protein